MNIIRFVDASRRFIGESLTAPSYVNKTGLTGAIISLLPSSTKGCCNLDHDGCFCQIIEPLKARS
jgi:hypothetical protein